MAFFQHYKTSDWSAPSKKTNKKVAHIVNIKNWWEKTKPQPSDTFLSSVFGRKLRKCCLYVGRQLSDKQPTLKCCHAAA